MKKQPPGFSGGSFLCASRYIRGRFVLSGAFIGSLPMLDSLKRLFSDFTSGNDKLEVGEEEVRLAAAALLFHVVAVDGVVTPAERAMLADLLKRRFDLDAEETGALMAAAESADAEAVDLYRFTSALKQRLESADRERIIEMMWKLGFADGRLDEFEDNVIWRVAELLGVSTQARIRLKQAARDRPG
jgi:uncharacterized tellurite resistance protein B-like protein